MKNTFKKLTLTLNFLHLVFFSLSVLAILFSGVQFAGILVLFCIPIIVGTLFSILYILEKGNNKILINTFNFIILVMSIGPYGVILEEIFRSGKYLIENNLVFLFIFLLPLAICNLIYVNKK
mgnify:CR=1 FL=1